MNEPVPDPDKSNVSSDSPPVQILRKRLLALQQANQQLESRNQSLEAAATTLQQQLHEIRLELQNLRQPKRLHRVRTLALVNRYLKKSASTTSHLLTNYMPWYKKTKPDLEANLDWPTADTTVSTVLEVKGWAVANSGQPMQVAVWLENIFLGLADYGIERWDVLKSRPRQTLAACGFEGRFQLDEALFRNGPLTLKVFVSAGAATSSVIIRPVRLDHPVVRVTEEQQRLYQDWLVRTEPSQWDLTRQGAEEVAWAYRPFISLITPVYNTPPEILRATIESVLGQTYSNWELCLVDGASTEPKTISILQEYNGRDSRIRFKLLKENSGISANSNAALEISRGEFIGLLDHDDLISADALYENVRLLNRYPQADIIYSDEDKLNLDGQRISPFFKPDWSPELFETLMYTAHLGLYRASLIQKVGGFRPYLDGAQDHDMVLRLSEQTNNIYHIPKVLYHWRMTPISTAFDSKAKPHADTARLRALEEYCLRLNRPALIEPGLLLTNVRLRYLLAKNPEVAIIIAVQDQPKTLQRCLDSIRQYSTYDNYRLVIVHNDSQPPTALQYLAELANVPNLQVLNFPGSFNYAAINNWAVSQLNSEFVIFLDNTTEVITPDWIEALLEYAARPEIGAVGAMLLYPDKSVQHSGLALGVTGIAGPLMRGLEARKSGYFGLARTVKNVSAVAGACLMTKIDLFRSVNGFDEQHLPTAFSDVDYCLKLGERGLRTIWTPYAELYQHEARELKQSSGIVAEVENEPHLDGETSYMLRRWSAVIANDPYYNINLSRERLDYAASSHCNNLAGSEKLE